MEVTLDAHFRVEHQGARQPYLLAEQALAQVLDFLTQVLQFRLNVRILSGNGARHRQTKCQHQRCSPCRQAGGAAVQAARRQNGEQQHHAGTGHRGAGRQVDAHGEIQAERNRDNPEADGQGKQRHHPVRHQTRRHGWNQ